MGARCRAARAYKASGNGLTVTFYPNRSPLLLTIDAPRGARVLSLEWNDGDAWRVAIETYHSGRWESQLKAMAHPRPWLKRWRALVPFTGPEAAVRKNRRSNLMIKLMAQREIAVRLEYILPAWRSGKQSE